MKRIITSLLCFFIYFQSQTVKAQFGVDDSRNATQLVTILTNNSPCILVSNSVLTGDTFTPGKNSSGQFSNIGTPFPFAGGIILSTWSSVNAVGPFVSDRGGGSTSWVGDADLNQALGITSLNATTLEFDFIPLTNTISFNYLFASNEYQQTYPCLYSDGFAFLIKEKGTTDPYTNLAVLPGTTTPVSSKEIHPIIATIGSNIGCPAKNEAFFNGYNGASSPINFAGQVKALTAQTPVVIGKTYHIKLVIADDAVGKEFFDSSIFLEAGSFSPKLNIGNDRTVTTNNPICFGEIYTIDTQLPATYNYKWFKNGIEIFGETNPTLNISDSGTYKVEVLLSPSTCTINDEIIIEYAPQIIVNNTTLVQCDDNNDGFTIFNLSKVDNIIKNNNSNIKIIGYYESLGDAQGKTNPIVNVINYINKIANQILYARVENSFGCTNFAQVNLSISNNSIQTQSPIPNCDLDDKQDGLYQFDLSTQVTPQILVRLPTGLIIEYYLNTIDAVLQKNILPNIFKNTIPFNQTIYARIINGTDCYGIIPITLIINSFDPPNFQEETFPLCQGSSLNLSVSPGYSSYLWNTGSTSNSILVSNPGNYSVKVTDINSCEKTKSFIVKESGIATITSVTVTDFSGSENSIEIKYTGSSSYEFSIDSFFYQDNPIFNNIAEGEYSVTARDKYGCGISNSFLIYVLDYPKYFTPNGDGYNDYWTIKNLSTRPKSTIIIFDRYGKLIKQMDENSVGWNGTFNNKTLPADDYWFQILFDDNKTVKGHFSLKR